jgi:hypothetical protein
MDGPRYHIDYCFVPNSWINEDLAVHVGHFQDWVGIGLSDHVPMVVDVRTFCPIINCIETDDSFVSLDFAKRIVVRFQLGPLTRIGGLREFSVIYPRL